MPNPAPLPPGLLDVPAMAAYLGCSTRSAWRLISSRIVPVVRVGRLARVRLADLDVYIRRNTEPAIDERILRRREA